MHQLLDTPPHMAEDGRVVAYGKFKDPFRDVNLTDVDFYDKGGKTPRFMRNLRLKEWQHFGIIHPDYYLGFVAFDSKYMSPSFCFLYDRKQKKFSEHHRETGPWAVDVAPNLFDGLTTFKQKGYSIEMHSHLTHGRHDIKVRIDAKKKLPALTADITVLEDLSRYQPLVNVSPIGPNRPFYTHKSACPAEGVVRFGDIEYRLEPDRDIALMDVQKTFYPYRSWWNWSTFGGRDESGRLIALNLCQNLITDDENHNENCLWVDGVMTPLSAARFEFDKKNMMGPWRMRTTDGRIKLDFTPQGERADKINAFVLVSDFHQPFGLYRGTAVDEAGEEHRIDDYFGLAEYHYFRT
ncbi:MAG: DUF2804 domain-containing protein [Candidatus Geothermincolia bacterium]